MTKVGWIIFGTIVAIVAGVFVALGLPVPDAEDPFIFRAYFTLGLIVTLLYVGSSLLFLASLSSFKEKLKVAFIFICIGLVLTGIAYMQLPVLIASGQLNGAWKNSGLIILPFLLSLVAIFTGTRMFAGLFGIKNITTSYAFAFVTPVGLAFLAALLPHAPTTAGELMFDASTGFTIVSLFIVGCACAHILAIRRVASVMYTNAMAWFAVAFAASVVSGLVYMVAIFMLGDDRGYVIGTASMAVLVCAGLPYFRAAYSFNRITAQGSDTSGLVARNFFGTPLHPAGLAGPINSVDIVVYTATLVSKPQAIDTMLDNLRQVTARLQPGQTLSASDTTTLMDVYLSIEKYLLEQEPIRRFTKESLRSYIAKRLQPALAPEPTFWNKLPQ